MRNIRKYGHDEHNLRRDPPLGKINEIQETWGELFYKMHRAKLLPQRRVRKSLHYWMHVYQRNRFQKISVTA